MPEYETIDISGKWICQIGDNIHESVLPGSVEELRLNEHKNKEHNYERWTKKYVYEGMVQYRKTIVLPENLQNCYLELFLERVSIRSKIYLEDQLISDCSTISVPHRHLIPPQNQSNIHICIEVDNTKEIDYEFSQALSDEVSTNWCGIIGRMTISRTSEIRINSHSVVIENSKKYLQLEFSSKQPVGTLDINVDGVEIKNPIFEVCKNKVKVFLAGEYKNWAENTPYLYHISAKISFLDGSSASTEFTAGFRNISVHGRNIHLNDHKIFLRGLLFSPVFPYTAYPEMSYEYYFDYFKLFKRYGFNHIRFHSWCPPENAFFAADILGIYLSIEPPVWVGFSHYPGNTPIQNFMLSEGIKILKEYIGHPSMVMFSGGNEICNKDGNICEESIKPLKYFKEKYPSLIYTRSSGYLLDNTNEEEEDYVVAAGIKKTEYDHSKYKAGAFGEIHLRNQMRNYSKKLSANTTKYDYSDLIKDLNKPIIAHEIGQYNVFEDLNNYKRYTGIMRADFLEKYYATFPYENSYIRTFMESSLRTVNNLIKEEVEVNLRSRYFSGYQMLSFTDYPGHGVSIMGNIDMFSCEKGIISEDNFKQFNNETVVLAEFDKRILNDGDVFDVEISMYTINKGAYHIEIELILGDIPYYNEHVDVYHDGEGLLKDIICLHVPIRSAEKSQKLQMNLSTNQFYNSYNLFVYNESVIESTEIYSLYQTNAFDAECIRRLEIGDSVVFYGVGYVSKYIYENNYMTPFWTFYNQSGSSLGLHFNQYHTIFKYFFTEQFADWQWFNIVNNSRLVDLSFMEKQYVPLVLSIDHPKRNKKLGLIYECKVLNGRLLVCMADLDGYVEGRCLKKGILEYCCSNEFDPKCLVSIDKLKEIYTSIEGLDGADLRSNAIYVGSEGIVINEKDYV